MGATLHPSHGGRRTKLTPERASGILAMVRNGVPQEVAAKRNGVDASTYWRWLKQGEADHGRNAKLYREFRKNVESAISDAEGSAVEAVKRAWEGGATIAEREITRKDGSVVVERTLSKPDWAAAAWYLERAHRDRWSKTDQVNLRLLSDQIAQDESLTPEEREQLFTELAGFLRSSK